jgi:dihydroorotate dehydrogenase
MYRTFYRGVLVHLDAELIHHLAVSALEISGELPFMRAVLRAAFPPKSTGSTQREIWGLRFAHPLGLAAGFDKDGRVVGALEALGFSFIEVGTVTPKPQPGNPRPRLFRLIEDDALINRLGFPSEGMERVERRLRRQRRTVPLAISLGKNKDTPLIDAHRDYGSALERLYPYGDVFVVNVSSPNTPELRQLQTRDYLDGLLAPLQALRQGLRPGDAAKPLLIKISPDLNDSDLDSIVEAAFQFEIDGIIATNTTTWRDGLRSRWQSEAGGLSGRPLAARSNQLIRGIYDRVGESLPIIGVGGVFDGNDVYEKLQCGASLVQAYTGFIYRGPAFVGRVLIELSQRMAAEGVQSIREIRI